MSIPSLPTPTHPTAPAGSIAWRRDLQTARDGATALLEALRADRDMIRARLARAGKRDPMHVVTGRSALDDAVQDVTELIAGIDAALDGTAPAPPDIIARIPFAASMALAPGAPT